MKLPPLPKIELLDSNPTYKRKITVGKLRETTLTKRQASRALKIEPKILGKILSEAAYSRSSGKSIHSNKRNKKAEEKEEISLRKSQKLALLKKDSKRGKKATKFH